MHVTTSENQTANASLTKDDRLKEKNVKENSFKIDYHWRQSQQMRLEAEKHPKYIS